jgi:hypothetical protein
MNGYRQCQSKFQHQMFGELQCEGIEGHDCAHYCGETWWPNKRGLPFYRPHTVIEGVGCVIVTGWLLIAGLVGGAIVWLVLRR